MPLLTLISDIGDKDFLPGAIKGQLLRFIPDIQIIDVTHALPAFNYPQAAYVCRNAIRNFPQGTYHLILVNLFDEPKDHFLLAEHNGHFIACPDNGLITMILEEPPQRVVALRLDNAIQKTTLFYTAALARAVKELEEGKTIEEIGDPSVEIKHKHPLKPSTGPDWIEGQIIYIDQFENVIVNINRLEFEEERKGRQFSIIFKRDEVIEQLSNTYSDVPEGEKLAFFNAAGYLEIAINKGNAAGLFGLQGYAENQYLNNKLFYQTVKVFFQ
jgi:S-adenosylmethionine hydrolase